jgi:hypothetical protein
VIKLVHEKTHILDKVEDADTSFQAVYDKCGILSPFILGMVFRQGNLYLILYRYSLTYAFLKKAKRRKSYYFLNACHIFHQEDESARKRR